MAKQESLRLMDAVELGGVLGVSADTIKRWARQGVIPKVKLTAHTVRFAPGEVLRAFGVGGKVLVPVEGEVQE